MFHRIWPVIKKEFIQTVRDMRTLIIVLLLPPVQIILMGYAVNSDIKHISTVVVDQSRDERSRALIAAFTTTEYFDVVGYVDSLSRVREMIDRGQVKVGFIIPPDYSADLLAGRQASVQVVIDGSDPNVAQTALFAADAVAQAKGAQILGEAVDRLGLGSSLMMPVELRPNVLYNPDMRSVNFMIPGLIGMILQFQGVVLTSFAIVRERERGTLAQLIMTPLKPWELMLGKLAPFVLIAFWNATLTAVVGLLWFKVEFAGSFLLLMALSILFLTGSLGLGLLISTVSKTQGQAMQTALMTMLPAFLLTGLIFPLENLPNVLYYLSYLFPLSYFLRIVRGIALKGVGIEYLWGEVLLLGIFSIAVFLVSARRFQKRLA
ncbi:MAG: ABC transporter permease [Chloroflexi bacterium]|nr:ABC transporter permease [Chloroflexota bacterium]